MSSAAILFIENQDPMLSIMAASAAAASIAVVYQLTSKIVILTYRYTQAMLKAQRIMNEASKSPVAVW